MSFSDSQSQLRWLGAFTVLAGFLNCQIPVLALTSHDVADAVSKSRKLTTPVTVQIEGSSVNVSTYLNKQITAEGFKIDAALIAKTVVDLAPDEIARVTIYFYNTTMSKCDAVTVTAGDVKAFGAGATSEEQLLSTLVITPVKVLDSNNKVAAFLESGKAVRSGLPLKTRVNGAVLEVTAESEPWATDRDLKLEAMRLAEKVCEVSSPSIRKIRVDFVSVKNPKAIRQVVIDLHTMTTIHNGIETLLQPLTVAEVNNDGSFASLAGKFSNPENIDVDSLDALPGPALEDRSKLLARIQDLHKLGIGVDPFIDSFLHIEESTKNGEDTSDAVTKLSARLDEQEKLHKSAQEFVPVKKGGAQTPASKPAATTLPSTAWDPESSNTPPPADVVKNVLTDHKNWMAYYERRWYRDGHTPEDYPNYVKLLDFFGRTLRSANRIPEAEIYENKAKDIRAKKKEQIKAPPKESPAKESP